MFFTLLKRVKTEKFKPLWNLIMHWNLKFQVSDLVRSSVEETLNALLDKEADELVNAEKYERSSERQGYRSGHYKRNLHTTAGEVELKVPKLKGIPFETAIIERYRRRESSVEEALIEMYLAGVSVRRVEDITEVLWGTKVSPGTISNPNKKAYEHIETWRTRPLSGEYPYVYLDGVYLKRSWGGEIQNVSVKERGLTGVRLIIGDKNLGMLETIPEVFPDARYQRCTVHFYRNIFSVTPRKKMKAVALMLKAIHSQESKEVAREKAIQVAEKLKAMKLAKAAQKVEDGIEETLTYMDFPTQNWTRIRTNNTIERLNREIKRRTKAIGAFPDGQSALMLVCARLRHVAATNWGARRYMNMDHLFKAEDDLLSDIIAG